LTLFPRQIVRTLVFAVLLALGLLQAGAATNFSIPLQQKTLANGLTVIVSEDHSAPTFGLCIAYRIGFRLEPEGRTGFAHLFEHMMFEGTPVAPKGTLTQVVEGGGGNLNGDTRWDYTEYIETAPVSIPCFGSRPIGSKRWTSPQKIWRTSARWLRKRSGSMF
jgi:zinc protease